MPNQVDFGVRNDLQLRGIKFWESGEFQVGVQAIANFSNNPATHGGWGVTLQFVQQFLGGDNKLVFQYGRGGGTGFGTLARFYYPDFSINHDLSEARFRVVDVATIQPLEMARRAGRLVYQRDDNFLGKAGLKTTWISAGGRVGLALTKHLKVLGEGGYDRITKSNGSPMQYLAKATVALAISADRRFYSASGAAPLLHRGEVERGGAHRRRRLGPHLHRRLPAVLTRQHLRRADRDLVVGVRSPFVARLRDVRHVVDRRTATASRDGSLLGEQIVVNSYQKQFDV